MKLQIRDLSKRFGELAVLEHVNLELESGHIYCLMAPSGTGKTTLFRILMGLETADSGEIRIQNREEEQIICCGRNMQSGFVRTSSRAAEMQKKIRISAVFQEDRLCEAFSAVDNVLMTAASSMSREQVLEELRGLLPEESLNRPVFTLSGGQKRRAAICRALCASTDLLILDEPFTGLDPATKSEVIKYLQKKSAGKLTLLSTHQEEDIRTLNGTRITLP